MQQNNFLRGSDTAKFCLCQNMSCLLTSGYLEHASLQFLWCSLLGTLFSGEKIYIFLLAIRFSNLSDMEKNRYRYSNGGENTALSLFVLSWN